MSVNFREACIRHYKDAEYLKLGNRLPNAGHLYGLSAECGIKALLVALGYPIEANGDLKRKQSPDLRSHIDKISASANQLNIYLAGRNGAKYMNLIPSLSNFRNWDVSHRYNDNTSLNNDYDSGWELSCKEIQTMLQELLNDGVL